MTVEEIKEYCKSKHKSTEEYPFGDVPICYKLNGKIFAQLYPYEYDYKITLKYTLDALKKRKYLIKNSVDNFLQSIQRNISLQKSVTENPIINKHFKKIESYK